MPKCCAIIVTFNGEAWIGKCISSIMEGSFVPDILVIDNASSDGTLSILEKTKRIKIIKNDSNLGFGQANNIGIRAIIDRNYDYFLLINQDAFIGKTSLELMIQAINQNPEYGIVSPLHYSNDGINLDSSFEKYLNRSGIAIKRAKGVQKMKFVNAACWLVRSEVFKKAGLFHPLFFHYGEDVNFIQRVRYLGFKIGIDPKAEIIHFRTGRISPIYADRDQAFRRRALNEIMNPNIKSDLLKYLRALSHAFDIAFRNKSRDFLSFIVKANNRFFELKNEADNFDNSKLYDFKNGSI